VKVTKAIAANATARQALLFIGVGLAQLLLDWLVFVLLTHAGFPVGPSNVASRVTGACLGFALNGWLTFDAFGREDRAPKRMQALRFALFWLLATVLSTEGVLFAQSQLGLRAAWAAKPLVEAALACLSFFVSRHWIYR
jgi:putative flippase GtrA